MKHLQVVVHACLVLTLAACGGGGHLSVENRGGGSAITLEFPPGEFVQRPLPRISGGIPPYESNIEGDDCPGWVELLRDHEGQGTLAGTAPAGSSGQSFFCTYNVTESNPGFRPARNVTYGINLKVGAVEADPLSLPAEVVPGNALRLRVGERLASIEFAPATGGVGRLTYELQCELPPGLSFSPDTRVLSGSPEQAYRGPDCTYLATDSASPPESVSRSVALIADPLDRGTWRFRTRTVEPGGPCTLPNPGTRTPVAILPHAHGGTVGQDVYELLDLPRISFLEFNSITRRLTYIHPSATPILGTPNTYRFAVGAEGVDAESADDVLCLDIQFDPGTDICPDPDGDVEPAHFIHISLRVRDDAFWDANAEEYRCPDTTAPPPRSSASGVSNPVHEALGPVHARRALDVALDTVRDRVRGWTPDAPRMLTAITPQVGIGSLSGESDGFDYTGSSESASAGAEIGSGSWQAGLVGSYTRTELHYRAATGLAERGYRSGEHTTEILSLHPFAAWHMPAGGNLWTSLGAGTGQLRHRDDLGFPSWSRSDVHLRSYAVGGSVPVADILAGELEAEADVESFAFEIEGGGRISSALPTLRGRDWRAGLTWSAPVRGAPSLSVAYRHLTGDGPEGGQLEAKGSISVDGIFDSRLSLVSNVEGAFGVGDHEYKSWGLSGGVRFAPREDRRGLGVELDTRLVSPDGGGSADVGLRSEAGYGLRGGPLFPTVRPFAGVTRHSGDGSLRRSLGIDLRDRPHSRVRLEAWDRPRDRLRAIRASLRHRF